MTTENGSVEFGAHDEHGCFGTAKIAKRYLSARFIVYEEDFL
jgi:hypothetical protein